MVTNRLTDLLGNDNADWMNDPARKCAIPEQYDTPKTAGVFADDWFPTNGTRDSNARALCAGCPVATKCLTYAMERPELEGVWGGTTANERAAARGDKPRIPLLGAGINCGTAKGYDAHRKQNTQTCQGCRDAWNVYRRDRKAARESAA